MKRNLTYGSICTLGLLFMIEVVDMILILKPANQAVMLGDKFTLRCQTNQTATPLRWNGRPPGSTQKSEIIHTGYNSSLYAANFSRLLPVADGEYSLEFTAVREAAMIYECLEPRFLKTASAAVTVLESLLMCNVTCGNDSVEITGSISFSGDWVPVLEWKECDGANVTADAPSSITSNNTVTRKLLLSSSNEFCLSVTVRFTGDGRPAGISAENIPSYSHTTSCNACSYIQDPLKKDYTLIVILIVVGVVIAAIIIGAILYWYCCRRKLDTSEEKLEMNSKSDFKCTSCDEVSDASSLLTIDV